LSFILILFSQLAFARQFSFKLYFEDSASNKDSLVFSYDSIATFGIDTQFNEQDIFSTPFDSVIKIRIPFLFK